MGTERNPAEEAERERSGADHPAAHSMDTQWYAVDRDGHVALFESFQYTSPLMLSSSMSGPLA